MDHEVITSYVPAGMPGAPERLFRRKVLPVMIASCFACGPAFANPTGAQVVSGQVSISSTGNVLTVTNSPGSIINWNSFSINPGELTQFLQQNSSSAVLNRIVGQSPSQIFGALQSNGQVFLINPNGIIFGANSKVSVSGLVASTLDISNSDFAAGKLNFAAGTTAGNIVNQGNLTTPSGGLIYLIAPQVQNSGVITSPQGEVLLAAGHSVQLVDGADPNIQVVVSAPTDQAVNLGNIVAQGGKIGLYGALVNQSGTVSADSAVVGQDGKVVFKSSTTTTLSGNSVTSANNSAGEGGTVYLLGPQVTLTDSAQVEANGQTGGGTVYVGGAFHGADASIVNSSRTYIGANTSISANAVTNGTGGNVAVWSDVATYMYGDISAKGGAQGGNGGYVETSGKNYLDFRGIVDLTAPKGTTGNLLLDPYTVTINDTSAGEITPTGGNPVSYTSGANSYVSASSINTQLATANVVVQAGAGGGGDVTVVSNNLNWNTTNILTLAASANVNINGSIRSEERRVGKECVP